MRPLNRCTSTAELVNKPTAAIRVLVLRSARQTIAVRAHTATSPPSNALCRTPLPTANDATPSTTACAHRIFRIQLWRRFHASNGSMPPVGNQARRRTVHPCSRTATPGIGSSIGANNAQAEDVCPVSVRHSLTCGAGAPGPELGRSLVKGSSATDRRQTDRSDGHCNMSNTTTAGPAIDFDSFLARSALRPAYQPIVDLISEEIVGFEALARWPDLPGATPDAVFGAARANGRTTELDWACRRAALAGAIDLGLGREHTLFVNVEPDTLGTPTPFDVVDTVAAAQADLRVILELTERSLARRPAELLRVVEWARQHGWGIALDDVGAEPESLALLPFLAPDVVKLDMALVRQRANPERAGIMAAVMAHSERTGAVVLAEGIETQAHLDQALALGATLGQGWLLGRPGPLVKPPPPRVPLAWARPNPAAPATPFAVVDGHTQLRVGRKGLLLDL